MQLLTQFIDLSLKAIDDNVDIEDVTSLPLLRRLRRMNEDIGEGAMDKFHTLRSDMETAFANLTREAVPHAR